MTEILAPQILSEEPIERGCPRCGDELVVRMEDDQGDRVIECIDESCEYQEFEPNKAEWKPSYWFFWQFYGRFIAPISTIVGTALIVGAIGLYALFTPSGNWLGALIVMGLIGLIVLGKDPDSYCPECGVSIGGEDQFCGNCGVFVEDSVHAIRQELPTPLVVRRVFHRLEGVEREGFTLTLTYGDSLNVTHRLVRGRERLWRRVLDVGAVVCTAIYAVLVVATAYGMWVIWQYSPPSGPPSDPTPITLPPDLFWLGVAIGTAGVVGIAIHELGHGIALYAHDHGVDSYDLSLLFGVFPTGGTTYHDILDGSRGLRAAVHVSASGPFASLLAGAPVFAWGYLTFGSVGEFFFGFWAASPLYYFVVCFVFFNLVGVLNLLPIVPQSDGFQLQDAFLTWTFDRVGFSGEHAATAATAVSLSMIGVVCLLLLVGWFV